MQQKRYLHLCSGSYTQAILKAGLSSSLLHPAGLHLLEQALQRPWAPHLLENLRGGQVYQPRKPSARLVKHTSLYNRKVHCTMLLHLTRQDLEQRITTSHQDPA